MNLVSLPDIRGQEPAFRSRITRMLECHECFFEIAKIRVICPFVTFVIQRCRVMKNLLCIFWCSARASLGPHAGPQSVPDGQAIGW